MRKNSLLPFDVINAFEARVRQTEDRPSKEDIIDEMLDLLLLSLAEGVRVANNDLNGNYAPSADTVEKIIYKKIDGKTWVERLDDYLSNDKQADIVRVIQTETHRVYNEGAYDAAVGNGANYKTWLCMMLPDSRDTHIYLDNVTVPIEAEFYTYNGNKTMFPGQFGIAEEDCNCLCELTYQK